MGNVPHNRGCGELMLAALLAAVLAVLALVGVS